MPNSSALKKSAKKNESWNPKSRDSGSYWLKPSGGETGNHSPFVQGITESAKKDAIKKMEEAFKKK